MPSTIRLHRVFAAPPERVYKAFVDPDAKVKWLPPYGFTCKVHEMDARVGGKYKMSFTNFTTGSSHSWSGEFVEMAPGERVRYTDKFDDPNLPGAMNVTVTFKQWIGQNDALRTGAYSKTLTFTLSTTTP